ncbi:hypothetical protein DPMN_070057 [Dreissena polymorpha]|uniref:Uncharacterized protein n=1 Tax=Dreissena polymorpha TaxID=45954 RepID=A0A9D3Z4Q6_DREPO|nr:hypothetical protein DPMN_070057 [Dreissena polymorpha]
MQENTNIIAGFSARLCFIRSKGKSKVFIIKAFRDTPITVLGGALEELENFTYICSIMVSH